MKTGFQDIDIDKLVGADWNYKKEDAGKQSKLIANIKRNGQVENIIVRELDSGFFEVVNGNHRLAAFGDCGTTSIHVFNCGKISDAKARRIAIETNETRFETDSIKLAELIKEISADFKLEELELTMPFSSEEMTNMTNLLEFDWDQGKPPAGADGAAGDATERRITITVTNEKYDEVRACLDALVAPFEGSVTIK
jgi:ParB-like chromosome segregation protein Spo0J